MIPFLAAATLLMTQSPGAPVGAFMSALAAGDAPTVEAMLEPGATIMHDRSGTPVESTAAAIATFLKGCEGIVIIETVGEPWEIGFTTGWRCGPRGEAEMLLWFEHGRVVWVQLGRLTPADAPAQAQ